MTAKPLPDYLVRRYQARIRALDQAGPALRSVIELNPEAPAIAKALDAERCLVWMRHRQA